jgi:YVTN family beta-propeller protein
MKNMPGRGRTSLMVAAMTLAAVGASWAGPSGYHIAKSVTLGGEGGWDYIARNPADGHLFIARGNHMMVTDASGKLLGDITGLSGIHGAAFADGRAYITNGTSNSVTVVDSKSLQKLSDIPVGSRPDGIIYEPVSKRIFTFNATSKDATAVDTATGKVAGTVPLGGKPEAATADASGTVYVNMEDKSAIASFDAKTLATKKGWALAPCESPSGMAIDSAHGLLFSGCDNGIMAVSDTASGKVIATIKTGDGVDANRFDPATGYAFAPNGESATMSVVHEDSPTKFSLVENVPTMAGARTMEIDPATHTLYTITADMKPGTPTADRPKPRPVPVPGSFRLLILSR